MTALGIYLLSSMVFAVGALLEFAVVIVVDRFNNSKKEHTLSKARTQYTSSQYLEKHTTFPSIHMRNITSRKTQLFQMNNSSMIEGPDAKIHAGYPYLSVDKIDAISFWSYLIIYLLCNVVYWIAYLDQ